MGPFVRRLVSRGVGGVLAAALASVALPLPFGCQAIVGKDPPRVPCTGTALTACAAGQYCRGSQCVPCETQEVCDGYDNDCNGVVDDPGSACPTGQTCDSVNKVCLGGDGGGGGGDGGGGDGAACSTATCPPPRVCDAVTGACVAPTLPLGAPCSANAACISGVCGDSGLLGTTVFNAIGAVCTQTCCSSGTCPTGSLCLGTGSGNYCVPAAGVGFTGTLGAGLPGAACAADGDCRSGSCTGGRCVDVCCSDTACTNGTHCRVTSAFRGHTVLACQPGGGNGQDVECFNTSTNCSSNACMPDATGSFCATPCCSSAACGSNTRGTLCNDEFPTLSADYVSLCSFKGTRGTRRNGAPCMLNSDCVGARCYPFPNGAQLCSDVCCVDSDCNDPNEVCRPFQVPNAGLLLRCVPKT